jgi:hypothetical protein
VWLGTWSLETGVCELELGFFVLNVVCEARRGGAGTRPFLKTGPAGQPDSSRFEEFQPEPVKIGTKTTRISAVQGGSGWLNQVSFAHP